MQHSGCAKCPSFGGLQDCFHATIQFAFHTLADELKKRLAPIFLVDCYRKMSRNAEFQSQQKHQLAQVEDNGNVQQQKEKTLEELQAELDALRKISLKPKQEELDQLKIEEERHKQVLKAAEEGKLNVVLSLNPKLIQSLNMSLFQQGNDMAEAAKLQQPTNTSQLLTTPSTLTTRPIVQPFGSSPNKPVEQLITIQPEPPVQSSLGVHSSPRKQAQHFDSNHALSLKASPQHEQQQEPVNLVPISSTFTSQQSLPQDLQHPTAESAQLGSFNSAPYLLSIPDINTSIVQFLQKEPKNWRMDNEGNILSFTLTDARCDIMYRLQSNKLYTLEECKILLKEILKVAKRDAEIDFKNLMFLSRFRTERLFPRPINPDYLGDSDASGFNDSPEERELIYGPRPAPVPTVFIPDNEPSMLKPKENIQKLIVETNKSLVKLIDGSLSQRKERILLAATIIEELEQEPEIAAFTKRAQADTSKQLGEQ